MKSYQIIVPYDFYFRAVCCGPAEDNNRVCPAGSRVTRPCAHGVTVLAGGRFISIEIQIGKVILNVILNAKANEARIGPKSGHNLDISVWISGCVIPSTPAEFRSTHR